MKLKRFTTAEIAEIRLETREDKPPVIQGYGAVFYDANNPATEYELYKNGKFRVVERILPGAFDRAIAEDDIRSLFNHDSNYVLGRNKAGTVKLSVDDFGLRYEVTPPDTQMIRDAVITPMQRGDVSGSSFMFEPTQQAWVEEENQDVREIREVKLWELGPVTFPAYTAATSGLRSLRDLGDEYQDFKTRQSLQDNSVLVLARASFVRESEENIC